MTDKEIFSKNLRLLIKYGLSTMSELAKATGIPLPSISTWANGRFVPKYENLKKIADYYGIKEPYTLVTKELTIKDIIDNNSFIEDPEEKKEEKQEKVFVSYSGGVGSPMLEQLEKLIDYLDKGYITQEEYQKLKDDLLK